MRSNTVQEIVMVDHHSRMGVRMKSYTPDQRAEAQAWVSCVESRMQADPQSLISAEELNALLKLLDYPRPFLLDFKTGMYGCEYVERLLRTAREVLRPVEELPLAQVIDIRRARR